MKNTLIFDLDGTLLDTLGDLSDGVNFALQKNGLPTHSIAEIRRFLGNGARNLIAQSVSGGEENALFEKVFSDFKEYYTAHSMLKTKPYPGILLLLERLRAEGFRIAVVSNKPDTAVQGLWKEFFSDSVEYAVGERENVRRKPCPDSVFAVMTAFEAKRESCIFIGDSEVDMETAKNAEIPCVIVTWGFRDREQLEDMGQQHFADTADALYREIHSV